jgi:hypothetical protein
VRPLWKPNEFHEIEHKLNDADNYDKFRGYFLIRFSNYRETAVPVGNKKDKTELVKHGFSADYIHKVLNAITDDWPRKCYDALFVHKAGTDDVEWLEDQEEFFAWIAGQLPHTRANPFSWASGPSLVPKGEFFAYVRQRAVRYNAVEVCPHTPPIPGHYYAHREVVDGNGDHLERFLQFFNPATDVDRELLRALVLTACWGGPPGKRPVFLIVSDDNEPDEAAGRGAGKTTVAEKIADLVGGHVRISSTETYDGILKRLLSAGARDKRVAVLDNLKTMKFSWAEFEGLVTGSVVSGHRMFKGEGSRPNTLVWILTMNGGSLSKDMAKRTVCVKVRRPDKYLPEWEEEVGEFLAQRRWDVLADVQAELKKTATSLKRHTRWSLWEKNVLAHCQDVDKCQEAIEDRQRDMDADADEKVLVRETFVRALTAHKLDPDTSAVFISSRDAAALVESATGEKRPTPKATTFLKGLGILELRKHDHAAMRGFAWRGSQSLPGASLKPFNPYSGNP